MKIILDAMGGDNAPDANIKGAVNAINKVKAEVILVGKTIDGVYSADPKNDANAVKFDEISYDEILKQDLKVMDGASIALCRDNNIKLIVFELAKPENIIKAVKGEKIGTLVQ